MSLYCVHNVALKGLTGRPTYNNFRAVFEYKEYSFSGIRGVLYYSLDNTGKLLVNRPVRPYLSFGSGTSSIRLSDEGYFNELT